MKAASTAGVLIASLLLAGCATRPAGEAAPAATAVHHDWAEVELAALPSGVARAKLHHWARDTTADTAILLLHGGGGSKDEWAPLSVPGYSLGEALAARGLHVYAMDLPGQNDTKTAPSETFEHGVDVVVELAGRVRAGEYALQAGHPRSYDRLAVVAQSLGGIFAIAAQAKAAPFDAMVIASFSLESYGEDVYRCHFTREPVPEGSVCTSRPPWAETSNMDPAVMEELPRVWARGGGTPQEVAIGAAAYLGTPGWAAPEAAPASRIREDAKRIRVPVFVVAGAVDRYFEPGAFDDEAARYPGAKVDVRLFEKTGHVLFQHLNRQDVYAAVADWILEAGLRRGHETATTRTPEPWSWKALAPHAEACHHVFWQDEMLSPCRA